MATVKATVCESIVARAGEMRRDLGAHIAIPTGHNHTPGLDAYRDIVTTRLRRLGARTDLVAGRERPGWIVGQTGAGAVPPTAVCRREVPGKPRVLIAGHLDTVFPENSPFNALTVSGDGATATGPGVVDMKGGILIALVALEALHDAGVRTSWTFLLNSDEETGSYCSDHVLRAEARRHDVGLALEPALPGGALAIGRKGSGQFMIEVFGRSAHAGREFEKGVSAVYGLARAMNAVEGMSDLGSGVTVNIGPIGGGTATNVVPDFAWCRGNARYPERRFADELGTKLDALATGDNTMPRVVVHRSFNRPAKPRTREVERLGLLARRVAEDLGQSLPFAETGGVCDGNILQDEGLPTIDTLGVRGGGLHTHDEWIELKSLEERAMLMASLLMEIDGGAPAGE
ncbi:MAG: M20/M25/M40 family metallo-hydrolase [Phycisphaeraceae bacterium]|nr:M20/M25/M40 family metallo-hydrolase [Phycisphaerales bacterium]MCB9843841.1 M20/M25/M40 family metallo-hydrolase [Phycisphaeraceae bacterium]